MTRVFFLEHLHVLGEDEEDVKALGIYSTREAALAAVERFRKLPGFSDTPQMADHSKPGPAEGFNIDEYELDQDNWSEGYETRWS
jgi:hypothetical protein